jgi:serine/threonine protein kinase/tetratricopeptide (TPR) repeat protein
LVPYRSADDMIRDSVIDWKELSDLYERAEGLDADGLAAFVASLHVQRHRLLPQLERMLDARARIAAGSFLESLPRIEAPWSTPTEWAEGRRIGAYRLLRHLGAGGMAEVWLAERADGAFERQVAIKLLFRHASSRERDALGQRFARERDILASLRHPNIATLHDAGVTPEGQPWLALEYVEGEPITTWCDQRRLGIRERIELFRQVLRAVRHAHANLVIHRDLKPANILVTRDGEVCLLDFGIAKLIEPEGDGPDESELTRQSGRPLTLPYASPEQIRGQPLTTACDVYSLGVVLYELLCGERPYELTVRSAAQVEQAILDIDPRLPSRRSATVEVAERRSTTISAMRKLLAGDLDALVCKCLSKHPGDRYSSAEALAADLERWLDGRPVAAKPTSWLERSHKFARRHRLAVLSSGVAAAALATLTVLTLVMGLKARDEAARAVAARDFLTEMFRVADPDRAKGTEPTARHILENASERAVVDLKDQPELLASVLTIVAQMQENMGQFTVADKTLARLATIQERLGQRRELARTQTARALNAYQLGEDARAEALVLEADRAAETFPDDHELQAKLLLTRGWISRGAGRYEKAREEMTIAMKQATLAFGPNHFHTLQAIRGLAEVEGELGRHDAALQLLADAVGRSQLHASSDERYRLEVAIVHANALLKGGRFMDAAAAGRALMPECVRLSGRHSSDCDFLRRLWAAALLRSEGPESALPLVDDLLVSSANPSAPLLQAVSAITAARVLSETGRLASRPELRRQLGTISAEASLPSTYRIQALLGLAEADLFAGAYSEAERWARQAISLLESPRPARFSGRAKVTLGLSLAGQGRTSEGLALLESAEPELDADLGREHPLRILYGLNRAILLNRSKRAPEASRLVDAALPKLRAAFGAASPAVARAEAMTNGRLASSRTDSESARFADAFL